MPIYSVKGVKKDGLQKYNVRINYTTNGGEAKQLTRTVYGKEAATDLKMRLTAEYKGRGGEVPAKKMTVQTLYEKYMAARKPEIRGTSFDKKIENLTIFVLPTLKDVRLDRLTTEMLQDWKLEIGQRLTKKQTKYELSSKRQFYNALNAMLNFAVKMEYIPKNPLKALGNFTDVSAIEKEMQYYTAHEFQEFISVAKEIAQDKETNLGDLSEWDYFVFFAIAFYTGLRKGEIHALKWSDLKDSFLTVWWSVQLVRRGEDIETPPKNKSSRRTLQMPLPLIKILEEHRKRQQACLQNFSDDYRICGGEDHLRDSTIDARRDLYVKEAGVKRITIHEFRHSHVSVLANERINIQEIARRLGHSKIEQTWRTYSHMYPREQERAVDVLNIITT